MIITIITEMIIKTNDTVRNSEKSDLSNISYYFFKTFLFNIFVNI